MRKQKHPRAPKPKKPTSFYGFWFWKELYEKSSIIRNPKQVGFSGRVRVCGLRFELKGALRTKWPRSRDLIPLC